MTLITVGIALLLIISGVGIWGFVRNALRPASTLPATTGWFDEVSTERYLPMVHLLSEDDLSFLRQQPGFTPRMEKRLRRDRCRAFRAYLQSMQVDFSRICTALKLIILQSRQDRPDLASALVRSQAKFAWAMTIANLNVSLYRLGISGPDMTGLLSVFEGMRVELRILIPATQIV